MLLNRKLVLGTVQFGLPYGINNANGQTEKAEAFKILQTAKECGIDTLDTAPAYGSAMQTLGEFFKSDNSFKVISKFHGKTEKEIIDSVDAQLKVLNRMSLDVLLFHSYKDWLENPSVVAVLQQLKHSRKVDKIGISLYTNDEFLFAIESGLFDVIQVPFNILDNYSLKGDLLIKAKSKGIEVHTRSVFLQGLFFKSIETLPAFFSPLIEPLLRIHELCRENNLSIHELALLYALHQSDTDRVLIGVNTDAQLLMNIDVIKKEISLEVMEEINKIKIEEVNLLNPVSWPKA